MYMERKIKVFHPERLRSVIGEESFPGGLHDTKPSLGILDERRMVLFTCHHAPEEYAHDALRSGRGPGAMHTVMYRSGDAGRTWGNGMHMPFLGYEPSVTVIGSILLVQTHYHQKLRRFESAENCIAYLYRSDDAGRTWRETKIDSAFLGEDFSNQTICCSRNFVLLDGMILIFVNAGRKTFRLSSVDRGLSWKIDSVHINIENTGTVSAMCEAFSYLTPSGRFLALGRVAWDCIPDQKIPYRPENDGSFDTDNGTGLLMMESKDSGLTWEAVRGIGYGGMMYPSVFYFDPQRFLFTYTKRLPGGKPYPHMGVQAITASENVDGGFLFDFDRDVIILDDKTPDYVFSGSGFGTTQRLEDGSFITPYSYRVMTERFEDIMKHEKYLTDESIFLDYCTRSGNVRYGEKPDIRWWRNSTKEWKKVIICEYGELLTETWCPTHVLRWKMED